MRLVPHASLYLMTGLAMASVVVVTGCSKNPKAEISPTSVPTSAEVSNNQVSTDEKLGTKWGDEVESKTTGVDITRMTTDPIEEVQVHYANKDFKGKSLNDISMQAGQIRFTIESDSGERLPLYRAGQSYYVAGKAGQSYQLHYRNSSDKTYEIVASVDGIDVLDGSSASRSNSGYVLSPHDDLTIEGFRKSEDAVASFTFSNPEDSYANHNAQGSIDNTGVIGTVVYEIEPIDLPKPKKTFALEPTTKPNAFPADK